jgi:uncharacterized tellurite resistance protein B-like protein
VDPERVDDLAIKKDGLLRVFKLVNAIEKNQSEKVEFAYLVNPHYKISEEEPEALIKQNDKFMKKVIASYLEKLH